MAEIKKVPALRFKGFSNEWERCELGALIEITSASRVHKNEWTKSGVPFFRSSDVVANYKGLVNEKAFISYELYKELSNKSGSVQKNDLLVTGGGSIGIPYLIKTNEPLYFKDADLLWLKNGEKLNGYFLYTFFSTLSFRRYVNSITHIGTISHYTVVQAKSTPIVIPDKDEQDEIGEFLLNIDKLISLKQTKVNKLTNLKKAMLEKMFPKQGADVPEIRFKGFSGAWEERGFDELFCSIATKNYQILSSEILETGDFRVVDQGQNRVIGYSHDESKLFRNLPIIVFGDHTTILKYVDFNFIVGADGVKILKNKIGNLRFLYYCLEFYKIEPEGYKRHFSILRAITMLIPKSPEEQTKIGAYFQNLDKTITLHQTELEKLTNLKKACLEKMFV